MKKMKAEQKRKFAAIVAFVLIAAMILSAALPVFLATANAEQINDDYTIEANIGFDGNAKIGDSIPIQVTATNNSNKSFKGEVAILCDLLNNDARDVRGNRYAREVEIAPGGSKTVSFTVPIPIIAKEITVQISDNKKVISEIKQPINVTANDDYWVGTLSDNADRLVHLKPTYHLMDRGRVVDVAKTLEIDGNTDLRSVNTFVANDYDFAALNEVQMQKVLGEVVNGKLLVVGTESRIGSIEKLNIDELTLLYREALFNNDKYVQIYGLGNGFIALYPADLSKDDSDFDSWFTTALAHYKGERTTENLDIIGYTDRLPNLTDNTINVIFGIIYIYIAFIPILYVVLKKRDKREKAVKIVPIVSISISLVIYLVSFNTVFKKPIASVINYVDLQALNGNSAAAGTYMNIVSPSKGDVEIKFDKDARVLEVSDNNYSYDDYYNSYTPPFENSKKMYADIINRDDETSIILKDKTKWDNTYITMSDNITLDGGFDGNAEVVEGRLEGKITNNTGRDLDEAIVVVTSNLGIDKLTRVENFKAGDVIDLSELGVNINSMNNGDFWAYEKVVNPYSDNYDRSNKTGHLEERYKYELETDIMRGLCSSNDTYNNTSMSGYYVTEAKVMLVGFTDEDVCDNNTSVNNKQTKMSTISVLKKEFSIDLSSVEQSFAENSAYNFGGVRPVVNTYQYAEMDGDEQLAITQSFINDANRYETPVDIELAFDNPNFQDFTIIWNNAPDKAQIYNTKIESWEPITTANIGDIYNAVDYCSEYGYVTIQANYFEEEVCEAPVLYYVN